MLIAGIYIGDKVNTAEHLVEVFGRSAYVELEQRWACMRGQPPSPAVAAVTTMHLPDYRPKWAVLTDLMGPEPWTRFDHVIFVDDDIRVGEGFVDRFIALQQRYDFALAQPGRTWRSHTDWPVVRRRLFSKARQTRFVEIGPVTAMDKRFLPLAMPFSDESPMGWGYDLVWPLLAERHGLRLGIIDATPVDHSLRAQSALYRHAEELERMGAYLLTREHVRVEDIQGAVRTYR